MNFHKGAAEIFIPDGVSDEVSFHRTQFMAIGAHPDDLEIMAIHGILKGRETAEPSFFGVVATTGASGRMSGAYKNVTYEELVELRQNEQKAAAKLGRYSGVAMLSYTSQDTREQSNHFLTDDLFKLLKAIRPKVLYLHNLLDRHDTHIAVCLRSIKALRALYRETGFIPEAIYGCEVWRGLDWLLQCDRVSLAIDDPTGVTEQLVGIYKSQLSETRQYDLALRGRRLSNSTFHEAAQASTHKELVFALDLKPLIEDETLDPLVFARRILDRFEDDVLTRINQFY